MMLADAGVRATPESLGLTPVVLTPGQTFDVPPSARLDQATMAIDRFADRVARLEAESDAQTLQGATDHERIDRALSATRRRLAIAELAERSIREEIATDSH